MDTETRNKVKETLLLMTAEEKMTLFVQIYSDERFDKKGMREAAGIEDEYQKQWKEERDSYLLDRYETLPTQVLMDEYMRMMKEDTES